MCSNTLTSKYSFLIHIAQGTILENSLLSFIFGLKATNFNGWCANAVFKFFN